MKKKLGKCSIRISTPTEVVDNVKPWNLGNKF